MDGNFISHLARRRIGGIFYPAFYVEMKTGGIYWALRGDQSGDELSHNPGILQNTTEEGNSRTAWK